MDVFDALAKGEIEQVEAALAADPGAASLHHASGASLLAWAYYVGRPDAAPLVRRHLDGLDPHDAIIAGETETVRAALDGGWDGNALAPDGFTPLGLAAFFNRPAIFDLLLPLTRDIDQRAENGQRVAALHAAVSSRNAQMVERLLRAGADPDLRQAGEVTPLHAAALHGDTAIAAMLVLFGAGPDLKDAQGRDAAAFAREGGHGWLAERLEPMGRQAPPARRETAERRSRSRPRL